MCMTGTLVSDVMLSSSRRTPVIEGFDEAFV